MPRDTSTLSTVSTIRQFSLRAGVYPADCSVAASFLKRVRRFRLLSKLAEGDNPSDAEEDGCLMVSSMDSEVAL